MPTNIPGPEPLEDAYSKMLEANQDFENSARTLHDETQRAFEKNVASQKAYYEGVAQDLSNMRSAAIPELKLPKYQPAPLIDKHSIGIIGAALAALAIIGAKATKTGAIGAMNGLSSALTGYMQGRSELMNEGFQQYQEQVKNTLDSYRASTESYMAILRNDSLSMEEKQNALKLAALEHNDPVMAARNDLSYQTTIMKSRGEAFKRTLDAITKMGNLAKKNASTVDIKNYSYYTSQQEKALGGRDKMVLGTQADIAAGKANSLSFEGWIEQKHGKKKAGGLKPDRKKYGPKFQAAFESLKKDPHNIHATDQQIVDALKKGDATHAPLSEKE